MSLTIENGIKMSSKDYIKHCDEIADKIIGNLEITSRKILKDIESVRYTTEKGSIIVCRDGGILFAEPFVPRQVHKTAFSVGMRTNEEDIYKIF